VVFCWCRRPDFNLDGIGRKRLLKALSVNLTAADRAVNRGHPWMGTDLRRELCPLAAFTL
jgi:hypothetical protein